MCRPTGLFLGFLFVTFAPTAGAQQPGVFSALPRAGGAEASFSSGTLSLGNRVVGATWRTAAGILKPGSLTDRLSKQQLSAPEEVFVISLGDGRVLKASDFSTVGSPRVENLKADLRAPRLSGRLAGKQIVVRLENAALGFRAVWRAILRDGSNYLRQEITLKAGASDFPIQEITLIDQRIVGATLTGKVQGSPIAAGNHFFGLEHPMSQCRVEQGRAVCSLVRDVPVKAGQSFDVSSVFGVAPPDQLRRAFLHYLERERAHPYRTFLHYNTWYDIGYFNKFDEAAAVAAIEFFGRELTEKRGVKMDSFLFDDGWDDPKTLWKFHSGFPNGFAPLKEAAAKYAAAPGVWLSPWGGYGKPRQERLQYGATQGFETNKEGFALSGPVYYKRFRDTCLEMIRKYGINQFKFDGIGRARGSVPGSEFGSDFEAAIELIHELRAERPDIYINLTTGTWPSPFWLFYADSIWRGGEDHSFAGVGSDRQRWITYRDSETYRNIVRGGPLYPLNSLMLHGLIYAKNAKQLSSDPQNDFTAELCSYFGTGTQLQEMYITPSLLTKENWGSLAEAAAWSRRNADVLVDTHWVGGDPAKLEVYGWASWSPRLGIVTLRNPSDKPQAFVLEVGKLFELPKGAETRYSLRRPWREGQNQPPQTTEAGKPFTLTLAPFAVMTLEATPAQRPNRKR